METSARYFWAAPLQPFLPRKNARILACIPNECIPINTYCCRCGSTRPRLCPVKVKPNSASKVAGLAGGHIGAGIEYLLRKKVDIPCCSSCLILRWVGYAIALFFCVVGIAPAIALAGSDQTTKLGAPFVTELIVVLCLFLLPAVGIGIAAWFSWRSLPVAVYGVRDQLYFEFWSRQYQELILGLISPESVGKSP